MSIALPAHRARLPSSRPARPARATRGLTLPELLLAIVVLAVGLAGVLAAFGPGSRASADPLLQRQALAVAESLLEEVLLMPFSFCDADDAAVETATSPAGCSGAAEALGPESGEGRFAPPSFDHVNDYHGLAMSGVVDIANTAVAGLSAYSASVVVEAAALHDIGAGSGDALRITVTVDGPHGSQVVLQGWRTRHAPNLAF